jgi:alkyl hydroperoxide reductase subunit AhpF
MSELVGKRLVVGLTYLDDDGEVIERVQFHGVIVEIADDNETLWVRRADTDEEVELPIVDESDRAVRGHYTLDSTGEVVVNPDYAATYTLSKKMLPEWETE